MNCQKLEISPQELIGRKGRERGRERERERERGRERMCSIELTTIHYLKRTETRIKSRCVYKS